MIIQNDIERIQKYEELIAFLISIGFEKNIAIAQINELAQLSSLRTLQILGVDVGAETARGQDMLMFMKKNFREDQLKEALGQASDEVFGGYFTKISSNIVEAKKQELKSLINIG